MPGTGVDAAAFWAGADSVIHDLAPKNRALLAKRDELQAQIDAWHQARAGQAHDAVAYKGFLQEIGYLLPEAEDFQATTENVDEEIAHMAGPQLVVPIMNARFALNAARSEEHTSELQSLMRIQYAVFCLKKKTTQTTNSPIILKNQHNHDDTPTINLSHDTLLRIKLYSTRRQHINQNNNIKHTTNNVSS